ncbi:MAG: CBS domain-containing protein [Planctomycetota bacterium]
MEKVAELIEVKRRQGITGVQKIESSATALDAARVMTKRGVGSLLVIDDDAKPVGIVTERDLLARVVAEARPAAQTPVSEIMSSPVLTCRLTTCLDELRQVMRHERIRHVPVVNAGQIEGMISIGDLNYARSETMVETIRALEAYITSA